MRHCVTLRGQKNPNQRQEQYSNVKSYLQEELTEDNLEKKQQSAKSDRRIDFHLQILRVCENDVQGRGNSRFKKIAIQSDRPISTEDSCDRVASFAITRPKVCPLLCVRPLINCVRLKQSSKNKKYFVILQSFWSMCTVC